MKEIRAKFLDAKAFNSRIKSPDMEKKEKWVLSYQGGGP